MVTFWVSPSTSRKNFLESANDIWATQNIPEMMKKILMVLIPKPGRDLKLLNSHRPIALLSVYMKTINSMIKIRLEELIERNELINGNWYGFVKHRSAIDCVNHLLSLIKEKQGEGQRVMAIFLDLEDAFNNVNLRKLQSIMNRLGFRLNTRIGSSLATRIVRLQWKLSLAIEPKYQMKASHRETS